MKIYKICYNVYYSNVPVTVMDRHLQKVIEAKVVDIYYCVSVAVTESYRCHLSSIVP